VSLGLQRPGVVPCIGQGEPAGMAQQQAWLSICGWTLIAILASAAACSSILAIPASNLTRANGLDTDKTIACLTFFNRPISKSALEAESINRSSHCITATI
jgi:hypothetical protein